MRRLHKYVAASGQNLYICACLIACRNSDRTSVSIAYCRDENALLLEAQIYNNGRFTLSYRGCLCDMYSTDNGARVYWITSFHLLSNTGYYCREDYRVDQDDRRLITKHIREIGIQIGDVHKMVGKTTTIHERLL